MQAESEGGGARGEGMAAARTSQSLRWASVVGGAGVGWYDDDDYYCPAADAATNSYYF